MPKNDDDSSVEKSTSSDTWSPFEVETSAATLSGTRRNGPGPTIFFIHGLGSSYDDVAAVVEHATLESHQVVAVDLPGHRSSRWRSKSEPDSVLACVQLLDDFVDDHVGDEVVIIGHSVGGAIGVLLAHRLGDRCRGFISIEGNLIDSDCGALSRPTAARTDWTRNELFEMIDQHLAANPVGGTSKFLDQYRENISDHDEWVGYTQALVHHSADGSLLQRFLKLDCWRSYIYGADAPPEVAGQLADLGVRTTAITKSGHWPMYANPKALQDAIADDLRGAFLN